MLPSSADRVPERRRTIRIKRSGLLRWKLEDIDRPAIKFAETIDELAQAFALVHKVYLTLGYLDEPKPHGMLFGIHSLLPETAVFVAKSYLTVISTLTEIFDSELFGLPMDAIYRKELDTLREQNRKIVELSALVTPSKLRWRNLFMFLSHVMYQYSIYRGVNDLCIAVNPKHVRFYKEMLLFEDFGPERHYPRVDAPAVALRINMDHIQDKGRDVYGEMEPEFNLYGYFHRMTGVAPADGSLSHLTPAYPGDAAGKPLDSKTVKYFLDKNNSLLENLPLEQREFLNKVYPNLDI